MQISPLTVALLERYGTPILTFEQAAAVLKFPTSKAAYTARRRGRFPCKVICTGTKLSVSVVELARFCETGLPASQTLPIQQNRSHVGRRGGRPSKAEQVQAAALGISVKELRAQRAGDAA